MFLFIIFVVEYLFVDVLYRCLDGWVFILGDWRDMNIAYYIIAANVDLLVMSVVLSMFSRSTEMLYAGLATLSFFVNIYGLNVYVMDIGSTFYVSILQTILVLKLMLVLNRTIKHAGAYARYCINRLASGLANSLLCLYVWEVVKSNQAKRWAQ